MGLPQELIDYIMDTLRDDLRSLKACSLTCKAMFASARRFIHRTLCLTMPNNFSILTQGEEERLRDYRQDGNDVQLRFLSHMGERGLLEYARRVYIHTHDKFTPSTLLPHLLHFQSLDRILALTIEEYDAFSWVNHSSTYFAHFYPTLTSLTLRHSFDHHHLLLRFALQFPKLEDLCLEWVMLDSLGLGRRAVPPGSDRSSPLRGRLRLVGYRTIDWWPADFVRELPNGINPRSVELESFRGSSAQRILDACLNTLEDVTFIFYATGKHASIHVSLFDHRGTIG